MENGDEVPFTSCDAKGRKQICAPEERASIKAPPISQHNKCRDGTIVPFINCITILFMAVIVKGGTTILKNEIPRYQRKYGSILLPWCNEKGYMHVICIFI